MPDSEDGLKWWIRHVIVPLIGGGGLVAIVVALINRPPSPPVVGPSAVAPQASVPSSSATQAAEMSPVPMQPALGARILRESEVVRAHCKDSYPKTSETCIGADDGWIFDLPSARAVVVDRIDYAGEPHRRSMAEIDPFSSIRRICISVTCYPLTDRGADVTAKISVDQIKN